MSLSDKDLCNGTPLDILRHGQAIVRKEYDRAKAERDHASEALGQAQEMMRIWSDQLTEYQVAIAAVNPVLEV